MGLQEVVDFGDEGVDFGLQELGPVGEAVVLPVFGESGCPGFEIVNHESIII